MSEELNQLRMPWQILGTVREYQVTEDGESADPFECHEIMDNKGNTIALVPLDTNTEEEAYALLRCGDTERPPTTEDALRERIGELESVVRKSIPALNDAVTICRLQSNEVMTADFSEHLKEVARKYEDLRQNAREVLSTK